MSTGRTAGRCGSGGDCQKRSMSEAAFSSPSTAPDRDDGYCGQWPRLLRPLIDHRTVLELEQPALLTGGQLCSTTARRRRQCGPRDHPWPDHLFDRSGAEEPLHLGGPPDAARSGMGVRDQVPRLGKRARAPGSHRAHGTQHGDLSETARRAVTRGSVRLGDAGRRLDGAATRRASTKCRWGRGQGGGPAGVGFSHVEDLLTAVTPDCCLLHLSALTRPRAQDEGSKGAPLRLFADLVERRTDVSQNAQRQL